MTEKSVTLKQFEELEAIFRPSMKRECELFEKFQKECEEYSTLVFTCQKFLLECGKTTEARIDLGMKIYANVEVRDTKHVIVKIGDDLFAEMKLEDAIKFSEKKIEYFKQAMSSSQNRINSMNARLNVMLASINPNSIQK